MAGQIQPLVPYGSYDRQQSVNPAYAGGTASGVGNAMQQAGGGMAAAVPIAGAVMQGVGTIASIYGAYQQQKAAERQAREERRRYEEQKQFQQQQYRDQMQQQDFSNDIQSGEYTQNMQQRLNDKYGTYNARNRL